MLCSKFYLFIFAASTSTQSAAGERDPNSVAINVRFNTTSSLSYVDKIIVKRHRRDPNAFIQTPSVLKSRVHSVYNRPVTKDEDDECKDGSTSPFCTLSLKYSPRFDRSSSVEIEICPCDSDDVVDAVESDAIPIISFGGPGSATKDRQTLSSVGQLNIVELNFLDEAAIKSFDTPSTTPLPICQSESKIFNGKSPVTKKSAPEKKNVPTGEEKNQGRRVIKHRISPVLEFPGKLNRRWKSAPTYRNTMSDYFLLGSQNPTNQNQASSNTANHPDQSRELEDMHTSDFQLDVSDAQFNGSVCQSDGLDAQSNIPDVNLNTPNNNQILITCIDDDVWSQEKSIPVNDCLILSRKSSTDCVNDSYDFMQAPPYPKGDNYDKLHRASTSLSISALPYDVWQDSDSSAPGTRRTSYLNPSEPSSRRLSSKTEFRAELNKDIQKVLLQREIKDSKGNSQTADSLDVFANIETVDDDRVSFDED